MRLQAGDQECQSPHEICYSGRKSRPQSPPGEWMRLSLPDPTPPPPTSSQHTEQPSWPQLGLPTPAPGGQAWRWLESQKVLPRSFQDLTCSPAAHLLREICPPDLVSRFTVKSSSIASSLGPWLVMSPPISLWGGNTEIPEMGETTGMFWAPQGPVHLSYQHPQTSRSRAGARKKPRDHLIQGKANFFCEASKKVRLGGSYPFSMAYSLFF